MAAPNGTVWGSIGNGYLKLGIYTNITTTATSATVNVEVWLATKYAVQDSSNSFYYNNSATALSGADNLAKTNISIATYNSSGSGWSTSNHQKIANYSTTYTRGTADVTRYLYSKMTGVWTESTSNGSASVSATVKIPKKTTYTISYNANGGTGAPASQTKNYDVNLTLSSVKPTRTGYTFKGWGTSTSDTTANYQPGASYTANANITLYAIWQAVTYTISYNANGGTGAPDKQTKTHGVNVTLSSSAPTREGYAFKGWSLTQSGSPYYQPGYICGRDYDLTLYAVWELTYTKPRITNISIDRCDGNSNLADDGTYVLVKFDWTCDDGYNVSSIKIERKRATESSYANPTTVDASGTSGHVEQRIGSGAIDTESAHDILITITDTKDTSTAERSVNSMKMPIDVLAQNKGIAFGKPASTENTAEFAFDAKFDGAVYGRVMGLDSVPRISSNSDLNSYLTPGCYKIPSNTTAKSIANMPIELAGRLIVNTATGAHFSTIDVANAYITQEYVPYDSPNTASYKRFISTDNDKALVYGDWIRQGGAKTLWSNDSTGYFMNGDQTIELSEPISIQPTGIALVFSLYDTTNKKCQDVSWNTFFVPKSLITFNNGGGQTFMMSINSGLSVYASKYLYIGDTTIAGHATNVSSGTNSGITFNNERFVLRRVIGM